MPYAYCSILIFDSTFNKIIQIKIMIRVSRMLHYSMKTSNLITSRNNKFDIKVSTTKTPT